MSKALKITLVVVAAVVGFIILLLLGVRMYFRIPCRDFYKRSEKAFRIPGLSDGYVPQGLDYDEQSGAFLSSGYMTKGASRAYAVFPDGTVKYSELKKADGSDYKGHTGGIAHFNGFFYIPGSDGCDVFRLEDLIAGRDAKKVGSFKTFNNPAYCHIQDGYIYVGSFYRAGNYENPENEFITTPAGDKNTSVIMVFRLSADEKFGVDPKPVAAISARGLVQGMCFDGKGRIVLSTSYSLAFSHLYAYRPDKQRCGEYKIGGIEIPLYYLDSANLDETVKAPPMSEEIILHDGRIYILTESASNKYIFGKFISAYDLYAYKFD